MPGYKVKPSPQQVKRRRVRAVGYTFLTLALLGAIFLVTLGVKGVLWLTDDSDERLEYQKYLEPVVMLDPVPFDDAGKASEEFLLQSSMWAVLKNEDTSRYATDDAGNVLLPAADLDLYGAKLFGTHVKLKHQSFGSDLLFVYDEEKQVYRLPAAGMMGYYTPYVAKMKKSGDVIRLTVGYVPSGSTWTGDAKGNVYAPEDDKTMIYVLQKDGKSYYIHAIKEAEDDEKLENDTSYQKKTKSGAESSSSKSSSSAASSQRQGQTGEDTDNTAPQAQ